MNACVLQFTQQSALKVKLLLRPRDGLECHARITRFPCFPEDVQCRAIECLQPVK